VLVSLLTSLENFAAIVGLPVVSFLTVNSSAFSLARCKLFSEPSRVALVGVLLEVERQQSDGTTHGESNPL